MNYVFLPWSTDYNNINIYIDRLSVNSMEQKQLNKQWENAKPLELENDSNVIHDYDTTYHNYYNQQQMILTKWKCSHCQSKDSNNLMYIDLNNNTIYCPPCEVFIIKSL